MTDAVFDRLLQPLLEVLPEPTACLFVIQDGWQARVLERVCAAELPGKGFEVAVFQVLVSICSCRMFPSPGC